MRALFRADRAELVLRLTADAQSLQVFGYAGVLGEWELTATVTRKDVRPNDKRILWAIDHDARRLVHSGWSGAENR